MGNSAGKGLTRFDELKTTLRELVTLLLAVDHDGGFVLKWLNDSSEYLIRSPADLEAQLKGKGLPGATPLKQNLMPYMQGYKGDAGDLLVVVMTDGSPSDCNMSGLRSVLKGKRSNVFCSFLMCTDEDSIVDSYNSCIDPVKNCDISDDYESEKKEVERTGR
jgi:hypothetical protein